MMKYKAKETTAPHLKLSNKILQDLRTLETENIGNEEVISNFHTLPSMKTSLFRARREWLPKMPSARDDISIKG